MHKKLNMDGSQKHNYKKPRGFIIMSQIHDIEWIHNLLYVDEYLIDDSFGTCLRIANQIRRKLGWNVATTDPYALGLNRQTVNDAIAIEHIDELPEEELKKILKKLIGFLLVRIYNTSDEIHEDDIFRITESLKKYIYE